MQWFSFAWGVYFIFRSDFRTSFFTLQKDAVFARLKAAGNGYLNRVMTTRITLAYEE